MGDGHDDERQALANEGYTYTGCWDPDPDYPECELWSKYSAFWGKTLYRRVCLGSGGDSGGKSPAGSERVGYVPFAPPAQLQPAPVNPIIDTSYALNPVQPPASGFRKPPGGGFQVPAPLLLRPGTGIAGTGGSPAAFQPQAFGEAPSLGTGRQSGSANPVPPDVCYDLVFYVSGSSGKGPAYRGRLVFLVRGTGAVAAYCDAVSGCADPVHYGTPVGSTFKVTGYAGIGESFRADLDPAFLTDPTTGKRSGAFYIFPLAGGRTCTMGAIGISAGGEELKAIARMLRQCAKCRATLRVAYAEKAGGGGDDPAAPQRRVAKTVVAPVPHTLPPKVTAIPPLPTRPTTFSPATDAGRVTKGPGVVDTRRVTALPAGFSRHPKYGYFVQPEEDFRDPAYVPEPEKSGRPCFDTILANFPTDKKTGKELDPIRVYQRIGGPLDTWAKGQNYENFENACAARLSIALNKSGIKIPHIRAQTFQGGDKNYYFIRAADMGSWLRTLFDDDGSPEGREDLVLHGNGIDPAKLKGKYGIYFMVPALHSGFDATGHVTILKGTGCGPDADQEDCYFDAAERVYIWSLPRCK